MAGLVPTAGGHVRLAGADEGVVRDVLFWGFTHDLTINFERVAARSTRAMLTRHAVTVLGRPLTPSSLAAVAEECPNLIGFKDGVGDIEAMTAVYSALGDRLTYLGGLPTAEVYAAAYLAMGVPTYSSAVFNFIPRTAQDFYAAVTTGDMATVNRLLKDFFFPYLAIRNRQPGYAVSIVKAGAEIIGRGAGPVRSPLSDLTAEEKQSLRSLVEKLGPQ